MSVVRKRGRPKKKDSKNGRFECRMSDEELDMLDYIAMNTEVSRADVVRNALKLYYDVTKYKH